MRPYLSGISRGRDELMQLYILDPDKRSTLKRRCPNGLSKPKRSGTLYRKWYKRNFRERSNQVCRHARLQQPCWDVHCSKSNTCGRRVSYTTMNILFHSTKVCRKVTTGNVPRLNQMCDSEKSTENDANTTHDHVGNPHEGVLASHNGPCGDQD